MQRRSHTSYLRIFFEHLLLPRTLGLRWLFIWCFSDRQQASQRNQGLLSATSMNFFSRRWSHAVSKAIAWVPQRGSNNSVELPAQLPKDDSLLKDLDRIKTQALEIAHLSPTDVTAPWQAKLMADHLSLLFEPFLTWNLTCTKVLAWENALHSSAPFKLPLTFTFTCSLLLVYLRLLS